MYIMRKTKAFMILKYNQLSLVIKQMEECEMKNFNRKQEELNLLFEAQLKKLDETSKVLLDEFEKKAKEITESYSEEVEEKFGDDKRDPLLSAAEDFSEGDVDLYEVCVDSVDSIKKAVKVLKRLDKPIEMADVALKIGEMGNTVDTAFFFYAEDAILDYVNNFEEEIVSPKSKLKQVKYETEEVVWFTTSTVSEILKNIIDELFENYSDTMDNFDKDPFEDGLT